MFVYLYWYSFCVVVLNHIQEGKGLGYIMGNTTFNRSPLLRSTVKMKLILNKSNAKLLSDVKPPPEPWSLFFLTLQQHLLCDSPGPCVTANWTKENEFMAYMLTKKIMSWWDLGFKKVSFISGQKGGRNSNSNYTKICFVRCRPGNGGCQMENTLCSVCWCLRVMMTPFVSLLSFVPIAAVISFPLSPQILFLITVLKNCAI